MRKTPALCRTPPCHTPYRTPLHSLSPRAVRVFPCLRRARFPLPSPCEQAPKKRRKNDPPASPRDPFPFGKGEGVRHGKRSGKLTLAKGETSAITARAFLFPCPSKKKWQAGDCTSKTAAAGIFPRRRLHFMFSAPPFGREFLCRCLWQITLAFLPPFGGTFGFRRFYLFTPFGKDF